jgi:hypothetical protein
MIMFKKIIATPLLEILCLLASIALYMLDDDFKMPSGLFSAVLILLVITKYKPLGIGVGGFVLIISCALCIAAMQQQQSGNKVDQYGIGIFAIGALVGVAMLYKYFFMSKK